MLVSAGCGGTEQAAVEEGSAKDSASAAKAGVGDTLTLKGTSYKVTKVRTASAVSDSFMSEKADGVFVIVDVTLKNRENEPATISSTTVRLKGGNGKEYTTSTDASFVVDNALILEEIQPDVAKKVVAVYDIPKKAVKGAKLLVEDFWSSSTGMINLGL
jgi:hypothetical protein